MKIYYSSLPCHHARIYIHCESKWLLACPLKRGYPSYKAIFFLFISGVALEEGYFIASVEQLKNFWVDLIGCVEFKF
jgi:hypothetical protein